MVYTSEMDDPFDMSEMDPTEQIEMLIEIGYKADKELEQVKKERDELQERLAAAEAVCELLASSYLVLPGQLDRDLLKKWKDLKEKQ